MEKVRMSRPVGRRVYRTTPQRGLSVPMREIELSGGDPPVRLYDTSGPYGDPANEPEPTHGLTPFRRPWILDRGDVVELDGPSSAYRRERETDPAAEPIRFLSSGASIRLPPGKPP